MRKSPALLQEMINVGCQLTMMATSRGGQSLQGVTPLFLLFLCFSALTLICILASRRFSRPTSDHHRELHETDADDRAGPAGVQVGAAAAASL